MVCGTYVEEVQLIGLDTDAVREEQNVALLPRYIFGGEFVTSSGGRHCEYAEWIYRKEVSRGKEPWREKLNYVGSEQLRGGLEPRI